LLYREAREFKRWTRFRVACKGSSVWVQNVSLPTSFENTTFGTVINDLVALGFDSVRAKYWIWFDGRPPRVSAAGTGTALLFDASPGAATSTTRVRPGRPPGGSGAPPERPR
jgi:hypothetical protein